MPSSPKRSELPDDADPVKEAVADTEGDIAPGYAEGSLVAGKYRLTSVLGKGGMGAVWLARNTALDVDVAIKLIRRNAGSEEASKRLLQEARTAARLGHPSIVRIFDFGETERGDPFIVMEVLTGASLRTNLHKSGRLEAEDAVRTLLPVASGLVVAHAKGIVHRDLKPDNIILFVDDTNRVVPKIVDFGIAKLRVEDLERHVTSDGAILGSPDYMSPEQAIGRADIDHRADIWAFSVLLYECLTGHRPFDGRNYNALIASIRDDPPPPIMDFAAGDEELWAIIARGLEKAPRDRWPAMTEYGKALAQWARAQGIDNDISGTSIDAQWLSPSAHLPAPLVDDSPIAAAGSTSQSGSRASPGARQSTGRRRHQSSRPAAKRWLGPVAFVAGGVVVALGAWAMMSRRNEPSAIPAPSPSTSAEPLPAPSNQGSASNPIPASSVALPTAEVSAAAVASSAPSTSLPSPQRLKPLAKPSATPDVRKKKPDVGF